jgi:GNAT superfamily N-acetyltransferase
MELKIAPSLTLITPANCPGYRQLVAPLAEACWPEFMLHDPIADKYWGDLFDRFPGYQFGLLDDVTGRAAAMGNSVPLLWEQPLEDLPERGWDWAFEQAVQDHELERKPTTLCALQVAIDPAYRGAGISVRMVETMRSIGRSAGFGQLVAPVRPSQKAHYPLADIDHYVAWKTADGHPFDAWLRVHVRAGAHIIKVCHESMVISGSMEQWRAWTGMAFPEKGAYVVPGALNPVEIGPAASTGTYTEPNVWMVHPLG